VFEAEQRASTAEQRAAKANAQADQTRRDADQYARQLVGTAEKNADQIAGQAKTQAGQLLAEVNADAERRRAATHREVDDLTRQKDSIASHLAQVRQLLPGMNAVQAAQAKPAATGDPDK
jgi:cell division septum initiation protein DivIVA